MVTQPVLRPVAAPPATGLSAPGRGPASSAQTLRFADLLQQRRPPPIEGDEPEAPVCIDGDAGAPACQAAPDPEADAEAHGEGEQPSAEPTVAAPAAPPVPPPAAFALRAVSPDAACADAMREVALTIAGFCNDRAVNNAELWQVRMGLRADVVPGTTLNLGLSPHWLTLRFEVADPGALDLLSRGREALLQVLENTMARRRDISITFESP